MDSVVCKQTDAIYDLKGDSRQPIRHVEIKHVVVDQVNDFAKRVINAEEVIEENVIYNIKKSRP